MRWVKHLWNKVTEPRRMKFAYLAIYLLTIYIGLVTLLYPPQTVSLEIGPLITTIWAYLFIFGGIAGAVTVLPGWWWAERVLAISPVMLGLVLYLLVVVALQLQTDGNSSRLTQLGVILLAAAPFCIRAIVIREYSYEPRIQE